MIANLLEGESVCNQASGARVPKTVGPMMSGVHTECLQLVSSNVVKTVHRNRSERRHHSQEYLPVNRRSPTNSLKISHERVTNRRQQRIDLRLTLLTPWNVHTIVFPIKMLQAQRRDFTGAQAVGRHEHENRPVSYIRRVLWVQGCKQPSDITPIGARRQTLQRVDPGSSLNAVGEASCPVPLSAVTEEAPKRRSYVVHGNPTPTVRVAASQVGINIVDLHVCEVPFQCAIPPQEMAYLTPKLLDGGFAQPALIPRPAA